MVIGAHILIYSDDSAATRQFFKDIVGWSFVEMGEGSGWLIFNSGPSELGVHPTTGEWEGHTFSHPRHTSLSLICDNLDATMAEYSAKGVKFNGEVVDHGWGRLTMMAVPGADDIMIYEPTYPPAFQA